MKEQKPNLKLDFCSYRAALYACKNWHYSKSIPAGKSVKIGVWENDAFIGVIIFSRGANRHIGSPYGLKQDEVCELTRVALKSHAHEVSRMIAIAIKLLKKKSPGLRLIVSYADLDQNHKGGIYKAGNWIYEGLANAGTMGAFIINGKKMHPKTVHSKGWVQQLKWLQKNVDPNAKKFITKGKHKYLMPLDNKMKEKVGKLKKPH